MRKHFLSFLVAALIPLVSWAADEAAPFKASISNAKVVYDGDATAVEITVVDSKTTSPLNEGDYYIAYFLEGSDIAIGKPHDAGNYKAVVTGTKGDYLNHKQEIPFEVTKKKLTVTLELSISKTYGQSYDEVQASAAVKKVEGLAKSDEDKQDVIINTLSVIVPELPDASAEKCPDTYMAHLEAGANANRNYEFEFVSEGPSPGIFMISVTPAPLTLSFDNANITYGDDVDVIKALEVSDLAWEDSKEDLNLVYTVQDDKVLKNAGEYTINFTFDNPNYTIDDPTATLTIKQAELTIDIQEKGKMPSKTYGDKDPDINTFYNIGGYKYDDTAATLKLTMQREAGEDVKQKGEEPYYIRLCVNGQTVFDIQYTTALDNYKIVNKLTQDEKVFTINKKDVNVTVDASKLGHGEYRKVKVDALPLDFSKLIKVGDLASSDKDKSLFEDTKEPTLQLVAATIKETDKTQNLVNAGEYALTLTKGTESNIAKNYNIIYPTGLPKYVVDPTLVIVTALDQAVSYLDTKKQLNLTIDEEYTKLNDKENEKANVRIQNIEYASEGTAIREKLGESLIVKDSEGNDITANAVNKVGEHIITFNVDTDEENTVVFEGLNNFKIRLDDGKLTVKGSATITLDANAKEGANTALIEAYDGNTVNVTIKNLNNVWGDNYLVKETWYTLALPFDVKVSDLSKNFGYAIVNIPNLENEKSGSIVYNLTMQTVPANTLMLFKVAEDTDWLTKGTTTFNGVTIKKQVKDITDKGGHTFIPVYETVGISEANQIFLKPDVGSFVTAAAALPLWQSQGFEEITITPLNGYIESDVEDAASIRVFVEDIDGTVTAISSVNSDAVRTNYAEGWYTINGVKLNAEPTEKGIYINNGKKVVIK